MSEIDIILNAPHKDLIKSFKEMNLGHLQSFRNKFIMIYETQRAIKDEIIAKVESGSVSQKEADETLAKMYVCLQKCEDLVLLANEVIKEKSSTTLTHN